LYCIVSFVLFVCYVLFFYKFHVWLLYDRICGPAKWYVCVCVCVCVCVYVYEQLQACTFSVTQKYLSDRKIFKQILQRKMKHMFITKYISYVIPMVLE